MKKYLIFIIAVLISITSFAGTYLTINEDGSLNVNSGSTPYPANSIECYDTNIIYHSNYYRYTNSAVERKSQEEIDLINTVIVNKPSTGVIWTCEQTYVSIYKLFYGADSTSYANATKPEVIQYVATVCSTNPTMSMFAFNMWQTFDVIEQWWYYERNGTINTLRFHPYPWGKTNIVLRYNEYVPEESF